MFLAMFGAVESGAIYAIMALGVYLSFRVFDFPGLTVDGSFVTGAALAADLVLQRQSPIITTGVGTLAGFIAGCITRILHTKGKINNLLSGILMMIALYSINLRIMDSPRLSLLKETTFKTQLEDLWEKTGIDEWLNNLLAITGMKRFPSTWGIVIIMIVFVIIIKILLDIFLKTEVGLAIRATGDNQRMIRSFSASPDLLIILGIGISDRSPERRV